MRRPREVLLKQTGEVFPVEPDSPANSLEVFSAASTETLEALLLNRMNSVANLRKDIALLVDEMAEQIADIKVAQLLLHQNKTRKRNEEAR